MICHREECALVEMFHDGTNGNDVHHENSYHEHKQLNTYCSVSAAQFGVHKIFIHSLILQTRKCLSNTPPATSTSFFRSSAPAVRILIN